jgi:uncharacterized protein
MCGFCDVVRFQRWRSKAGAMVMADYESTSAPSWDAHIHILPAARTASLVRWLQRAFPGSSARQDITAREILADLEACGIQGAFNFVFPLRPEETEPLNLFSREVGLRYPQVVPFGSVHLETPRKDEVAERCICEYGLAGIKLHPYAQRFEVFCSDFEPLYRKLDEIKKPLFVHTGFDAFYGQSQDLDYLRGMLERYPGMPVVLVHSLFPRLRLARELIAGYEQLWLDMTNSLSMVRWFRDAGGNAWNEHYGEEAEAEMECFEPLVAEFSSRVLFGTDHPVGMGTVAQIYADLDSFGFDPTVRANLAGGAAQSFLEKIGWPP